METPASLAVSSTSSFLFIFIPPFIINLDKKEDVKVLCLREENEHEIDTNKVIFGAKCENLLGIPKTFKKEKPISKDEQLKLLV